jgi:hypothetical protein
MTAWLDDEKAAQALRRIWDHGDWLGRGLMEGVRAQAVPRKQRIARRGITATGWIAG